MNIPLIPIPEGLQTKLFCLSEDALQYLPEILAEGFPDRKPFLTADMNTWEAAGEKTAEILTAAKISFDKYIFPQREHLHPDYKYSEFLADLFSENSVPVAIGSGVINDLVKCASSLKSLKYCCIPTACSVDGFTSAGAALSVNGGKKTVKCPAPTALCADPDIMRTAPAEMLASGYADLLTKIPAGADWIIADAVGEEPIREDVWQLIQGNIRSWVSDKNDMMKIFDGLAATGYSMQMYLESRPASGAEHLFSHVWEMENLSLDGAEISHGFKVGVGLLASVLLMEYVIENDFASIAPRMKPGLSAEERSAEIDELLIKNCYGDQVRQTALNKHLVGKDLENRRLLISSIWDKLRCDLQKQLLPYGTLHAMLQDAGCPTRPQDIGLDREQFLHGIRTAQLIRHRYTIIDMLYELGLLEDAMKKLDVMMR